MDTPSILDTAKFRHLVLDSVESLQNAVQGFQIPEYDQITLTYYGSTNNLNVIVYKLNGVSVYALKCTYSVQPPTASDANLVDISPITPP